MVRRLLALSFCGMLAVVAVADGQAGEVSSRSVAPPTYASVVPKPRRALQGSGFFTLQPDAAIVVRGGAAATRVADQLAALLRPSTGYAVPVRQLRGKAAAGSLSFVLVPERALGAEGYRLRVTPDAVTLAAYRAEGLFRGVQTLRQLLPPSVESDTVMPGPWRIRAGRVDDRPRFAWRGAMLDVARHFFGVGDVERLVDTMALYKLNRLHLHLSDDQGWRIEIRSWPKLARYGGTTEVGGGSGGYFTQAEYRQLVAYAAERYVTVVPEIDMPGHTNAALASYAKLNCGGKAPALYTGIEVGFSSLCIGKEITYRFVDDVVRELAALTPGPYLHIGGDEAAATVPADYVTFVRRVQEIVRSHGKRMVGWEETARAGLAETSLAQHWHDPVLARRAVAEGAHLIMSPATKTYLDMKYTPATKLGFTWAGTTDVRDAYAWDPATQIRGVRERDILGVESPLWSETTKTLADLEFLAFPRLIGHAEIGWSPRRGRAWKDYRYRLGAQGPRLRALGIAYYASPEVPWR